MKKLFKFIGLIFKGIWKAITFVRLALMNLIFLVMIAVFYFAFTYTGEGQPTVDKESDIIILNDVKVN